MEPEAPPEAPPEAIVVEGAPPKWKRWDWVPWAHAGLALAGFVFILKGLIGMGLFVVAWAGLWWLLKVFLGYVYRCRFYGTATLTERGATLAPIRKGVGSVRSERIEWREVKRIAPHRRIGVRIVLDRPKAPLGGLIPRPGARPHQVIVPFYLWRSLALLGAVREHVPTDRIDPRVWRTSPRRLVVLFDRVSSVLTVLVGLALLAVAVAFTCQGFVGAPCLLRGLSDYSLPYGPRMTPPGFPWPRVYFLALPASFFCAALAVGVRLLRSRQLPPALAAGLVAFGGSAVGLGPFIAVAEGEPAANAAVLAAIGAALVSVGLLMWRGLRRVRWYRLALCHGVAAVAGGGGDRVLGLRCGPLDAERRRLCRADDLARRQAGAAVVWQRPDSVTPDVDRQRRVRTPVRFRRPRGRRLGRRLRRAARLPRWLSAVVRASGFGENRTSRAVQERVGRQSVPGRQGRSCGLHATPLSRDPRSGEGQAQVPAH